MKLDEGIVKMRLYDGDISIFSLSQENFTFPLRIFILEIRLLLLLSE